MAGLDNLVDNPITNNNTLRQSTIALTQNPAVLGEQLIRTYNLQNVRVLQAPKNDYQISQLTTQDVGYYKSSLGTPVMSDLVFKAGTYTNDRGELVTFDEIRLVTVLITISQAKNIVKTSIQGKPGTVKEYVGLGDYVISINGVITGPNGHYPKEDIIELKNMLISNKPIEVVSWFLQLWDIDHIVIDDFSINPEEGGYSYQPFTIDASSDFDINLRLV